MELLIGTRNRGKYNEITEALNPLRIRLRGALDFSDIPECPEEGDSYESNASQKALHYHRKSGLPALADDSGIEVGALDGAPGVRSARYGGEGLDDEKRCRLLLEALEEVSEEKRQARYVAVIALAAGGRVVGTYRGEVEGTILREFRGDRGFGYDPLFYFPPLHLSFGQLLPAVKRQFSHRGKALALVVNALTRDPGLLR